MQSNITTASPLGPDQGSSVTITDHPKNPSAELNLVGSQPTLPISLIRAIASVAPVTAAGATSNSPGSASTFASPVFGSISSNCRKFGKPKKNVVPSIQGAEFEMPATLALGK